VAHFPKPFYKKSRACWYVEIDRKQIKLGPDQAEAFRLYHELMAAPRVQLQQPLTWIHSFEVKLWSRGQMNYGAINKPL